MTNSEVINVAQSEKQLADLITVTGSQRNLSCLGFPTLPVISIENLMLLS